jgi:hypothetical protein
VGEVLLEKAKSKVSPVINVIAGFVVDFTRVLGCTVSA